MFIIVVFSVSEATNYANINSHLSILTSIQNFLLAGSFAIVVQLQYFQLGPVETGSSMLMAEAY